MLSIMQRARESTSTAGIAASSPIYCDTAATRCCRSACRARSSTSCSSLQTGKEDRGQRARMRGRQVTRREGDAQCHAADLELDAARHELRPPLLQPAQRLARLLLVGLAPAVDLLDLHLDALALAVDALDRVLERKVLDAPLVAAELLEERAVEAAQALVLELGEARLVRALPRLDAVERRLVRERHGVARRVEALAVAEGPLGLDARELGGKERVVGAGGERAGRREVGEVGRVGGRVLGEEGAQLDGDLRVDGWSELCEWSAGQLVHCVLGREGRRTRMEVEVLVVVCTACGSVRGREVG